MIVHAHKGKRVPAGLRPVRLPVEMGNAIWLQVKTVRHVRKTVVARPGRAACKVAAKSVVGMASASLFLARTVRRVPKTVLVQRDSPVATAVVGLLVAMVLVRLTKAKTVRHVRKTASAHPKRAVFQENARPNAVMECAKKKREKIAQHVRKTANVAVAFRVCKVCVRGHVEMANAMPEVVKIVRRALQIANVHPERHVLGGVVLVRPIAMGKTVELMDVVARVASVRDGLPARMARVSVPMNVRSKESQRVKARASTNAVIWMATVVDIERR